METATNPTHIEKPLKRQRGLGKLNRLIARAQQLLRMNGYDMRRFTRNYENGTALSSCKKSGRMVTVNINGKTDKERLIGDAFYVRAD